MRQLRGIAAILLLASVLVAFVACGSENSTFSRIGSAVNSDGWAGRGSSDGPTGIIAAAATSTTGASASGSESLPSAKLSDGVMAYPTPMWNGYVEAEKPSDSSVSVGRYAPPNYQ